MECIFNQLATPVQLVHSVQANSSCFARCQLGQLAVFRDLALPELASSGLTPSQKQATSGIVYWLWTFVSIAGHLDALNPCFHACPRDPS